MSNTTPPPESTAQPPSWKQQGIVAELEAKLVELRTEVDGFAARLGIDVEHVWATVKSHITFP